MHSYITHVLTLSDWQEVRSLQNKLIAFEQSIRLQRKCSTGDGPFNYLKENIIQNNGVCLLAWNNDIAVGFISGWITKGDGLDQGDNRIGYICDCFVLPEHRNQKVFKSLLSEMINYFHVRDIKNISTDTLGSNQDMQMVLEKSGFKIHRVIYEMPI